MPLHLCLIVFNLLSFIVGVYLLETILNRSLKKYLQLDESPTSILVFKAGFITCYGMLFYSWQDPVKNASIILNTTLSGYDLLTSILSYSALFWIMSLMILTILFIVVSFVFMLRIGSRNIFFEMAKGNMGYAILFTSTFFALTIGLLPIIKESYELCLAYPNVPMFR